MTLFYQLTMSGSDLAADVTINGFPLHVGEIDGSMGTVLNPFLVGKNNQLKFSFGRRGPAARFEGALQSLQQGDQPTLLPGGELLLPTGNELVHTFDSESAAFATVLAGAQPASADALLELALRLRDLLRARDTAQLLKLFAPKLACYAEAFGAPLPALTADIADGLRQFFDSDLGFEAGDIMAQPWCDGRVYLLCRQDGRALVHKDQPDGTLSMHIYAAMMEGGPAIVA